MVLDRPLELLRDAVARVRRVGRRRAREQREHGRGRHARLLLGECGEHGVECGVRDAVRRRAEEALLRREERGR